MDARDRAREASLERLILCDAKYTTFRKRRDYGDSERIRRCRKLGGEREGQGSTEGFGDSDTTPCGTIMMGTRHCAFVPTPRMGHTKSDPDVSCGHWVTMLYLSGG